MPRGRDPYLRSWVKVPTYTIEQRMFDALTFEQFGVFAKALLWSTSKSYDIGYFQDKLTGQALSLEEIARAIRPDIGTSEQWVRPVVAAFSVLLEAGILEHDDSYGYRIEPKLCELFLHENNLAAKRKADAGRQANKRVRDGKKPGRNGSRPPVMLRRVPAAGEDQR